MTVYLGDIIVGIGQKVNFLLEKYKQSLSLTMLRTATEVSQTKQSSLLRSKIWTGIPCTCHEPGIVTHWSGRGSITSTSLLTEVSKYAEAEDRNTCAESQETCTETSHSALTLQDITVCRRGVR
ncbi:hypothetical protein L9F63_027315 [Diploptera punctata]|uniref:Uncharacterized protein n=1 Tax=Diploptera punctata TaxID=6984 RepID=A0AAD8ELP1_DIPPU|nr:hypothetical protein L9F63_027315 [Diploptera punctata]